MTRRRRGPLGLIISRIASFPGRVFRSRSTTSRMRTEQHEWDLGMGGWRGTKYGRRRRRGRKAYRVGRR